MARENLVLFCSVELYYYTVFLYTDLRPEIVVALVDRFHYLHFGAFSFLFSGLVRKACIPITFYYLLCRLVWGCPY